VTAGYALLELSNTAPLVVTVHDNDLQTTARHARLSKYVTTVLAGADHVVYQSSKLQRMAEALIGSHPCSVIPWGINTYGIERAPAPQNFTVIAVARLVPTKGLDILVHAFHALREHVPEARLEIIGEGPERSSLRQLVASLGLHDVVSMPGWLPNRATLERVAASSAFVLPSYQEALGSAYLEAMSLGIPTVGVRGQGIADVIEDGRNGLLVPPRDTASLGQAMLRLARDAEWSRTIGRAGARSFIEGGYDWRGHAQKHASLYRELISAKRKPSVSVT
jgi:glycosyltransferase involved in cell wall biosynthesis